MVALIVKQFLQDETIPERFQMLVKCLQSLKITCNVLETINKDFETSSNDFETILKLGVTILKRLPVFVNNF